MFHHTPVEVDKENKNSQGLTKQVLRCKTPHRRPLSVVNSSDTFGATPSRKKLSTSYQSSFTPVRSLKKQPLPQNTLCILADESSKNASIPKHKETKQSSEEATLKLSSHDLNIIAEKQDLNRQWKISNKVNGALLDDDKPIADYVHSIIQRQLSILQDEVEDSYRDKDGTSVIESLSYNSISENINSSGEVDKYLSETDNSLHFSQHRIESSCDDTCSFSTLLLHNLSSSVSEIVPTQFDESLNVHDSTSLLIENNAENDSGNLSCKSMSEDRSESLQSTSLHAVDISDRSSDASPQWQLDGFTLITTRDTTDCVAPFQSTWCPVEMKDGFSQTSPIPHVLDYNSPVDKDDFSNKISILKRETTLETLNRESEAMDVAVTTIPVNMVNGFSQMTPASSKKESTTTPWPELNLADGLKDFLPKELIDVMSQTTPKSWQEQETCMTPVAELVTVDEAVNITPATMKDTSSQMTPHFFNDQSTAITPHHASDATTCTSPLANINLNFDQSEKQENPELQSHLETAVICNEILRQDIQSLESKVQGMRTQVKEKEQEVALLTDNLSEKEQYIKASHQKLIDDLQLRIEEQVKQIGSLQTTLRQKSNDINSLEADISCMRAHYQKQIQNLQQDLCRAYRQHKKEAEKMKEEINQNANMQQELQAARDRVNELEESIKAFSHLERALEEGNQVQEEMECLNDYYAGLEVLIKQMEDECKKYQEENLLMKVKMEENDALKNSALDEARESNENISEIRMELELTKAEKSQLEELYSKASLELGVATQQYTDFLADLHSTKTELEQYKDTVQSLQEHQSLQDQKAVESCLQEMCLEASLIIETKQACKQKAQSKLAIAELEAVNGTLSKKCFELQSAHEVEMRELQSKLGELEEENLVSRRRISDQFQEIKAIFQAKAELYETKQSIKKMEEKYKESQEFVEQECKALSEALEEKEEECKSVILELSRYKVVMYTKQEDVDELQESVAVLRQQLTDCESELDNTKANAHLMLLNQLSEITEASNEISGLESQMITVFNSLMDSKDRQNYQRDSPERPDDKTNKTENSMPFEDSCAMMPPGDSLVASILHAVQSSVDDPNKKPCVSDTESKTPENETRSQKSVMVGSIGSAFTAVQPVDKDVKTTDVDTDNSMKQKSSLGDLVRATSGVFEDLLWVMKKKEMEWTNKKEEISNERQIMEKKLKKTIDSYEHEHQQLKERLLESECHNRRLHQNLQSKFSELANQEKIIQYRQQEIDAMATKLDRLSDLQIENKHLKEEIDKLQNLLKGSNMQRELLQKEMALIMQRLDGSPNTGGQSGLDVAKVMQENISLKQEMEKLKLHMMKKNDYYENLNSRATRQMNTLKENWKKAEEEIVQLDSVLDLCKKHVNNIPASMPDHHSIQGLQELFKD
ncbi:centromere-associated protein E-like [Anneissia japonica]|uniref:centromere-associated protein E-like n=1 Tax=Anneissia japonica TaxID=1529436 RepID=UPI0014255F95|nr:centromere-associated protein E-like [Anneissia japonica]